MLPTNLKKISLFFERLPGIGEKTANRLALYLLRLPEKDLKEFGQNIAQLKAKTKLCKNCFNLTEEEICSICADDRRDHEVIAVVENPLDVIAFETGNIYQGVYHVLHGKIDPLNRIGPDDIKIKELIDRVKKLTSSPVGKLKEIILATNPDMEGEATALYIKNKIEKIKKEKGLDFKTTRLAYGLPIGANLEYADYMTLKKAMENRRGF